MSITLTAYPDDDLQKQLNDIVSDLATVRQVKQFTDWWLKKNNPESCEVIRRLTQSVISHFTGEITQFEDIFEVFTRKFNLTSEQWMEAQIYELIGPFLEVSNEKLNEENDRGHHRAVCLFVYDVLLEKSSLLEPSQWKLVVQYLARLANESEDLSTVLVAVLALEKASSLSILEFEAFNQALQVFGKAHDYTEYFCNTQIESLYAKEEMNYLKYQIGYLTSNLGMIWMPPGQADFVDPENGPGATGRCGPPPGVAICPPCIYPPPIHESAVPLRVHHNSLARNDNCKLPTVRCAASVSTGLVFYEALLLTSGHMQIGWTTVEASLTEEPVLSGVADDQFGVALVSGKFQHQGALKVTNLPGWQVGDTIGCLADFAKQKFTFYCNGREVTPSDELAPIFFSQQPYFPAASLGRHQMLFLNFGQVPFKYPPVNVPGASLQTISNLNDGDANLCRLLAPSVLPNGEYYFKEAGVTYNAPLEAMFADEKQDQLDSLLIDYECGVDTLEVFTSNVKTLLVDDDFALLRLGTSLISEFGKRTGERLEVASRLVTEILGLLATFERPEELSIGKILALLFPPLQNRFNETDRHQNLFLILLGLVPKLTVTERLYLLAPETDLLFFLEDTFVRRGNVLYLNLAAQLVEHLASGAESRVELLKFPRMVTQLKVFSTEGRRISERARAVSHLDRLRYELAITSRNCLNLLSMNGN